MASSNGKPESSTSTTVSDDDNSPSTSAAGSLQKKYSTTPWDPLNSTDWDLTYPTQHCQRRVRRDIMQLYNDPPHGIFAVPDDTNLTMVRALIIGPYDTPYEGGYFYFVIRCPPDYPIVPPRVRLMTTGGGKVRFNPNLYKDGKVCLSTLGTWSGPAWSPAQTLASLLVSIQSLMTENPYHNEPGFDTEHRPGDSKRYNEIIAHETLRVAVCEQLQQDNDPSMPAPLREVMTKSFPSYYDHYMQSCADLQHLQGCQMMDPFGEKRGVFNVNKLRQTLVNLKARYGRFADDEHNSGSEEEREAELADEEST